VRNPHSTVRKINLIKFLFHPVTCIKIHLHRSEILQIFCDRNPKPQLSSRWCSAAKERAREGLHEVKEVIKKGRKERKRMGTGRRGR
jgi:hypothetical protein